VVLTMGAYNATFSMGAYHVGPVPDFNRLVIRGKRAGAGEGLG
jgi:hypothetical protein